MTLTLFERIAELCLEKFESLLKSGKPNENEWTILSCIVLQDEDKLDVVSLGTGTKCIGRDKMSKEGDILNDSHAEVICRRAFLKYILEQLSNKTIFEFNSECKKFRLKNHLKFHFFTTQVPCGDAAIFPKQNSDDFGNLISINTKRPASSRENEANKKLKRESSQDDIFRTGAKCLKHDSSIEANFHVVGVVRTKPGRGVPTLSVSCSDKIAKWAHLGIQGALLSLLLDTPIYLTSCIISGGTPYNEASLKRAIFERLKGCDLKVPNMIFYQAKLQFSYSKTDEKKPCPSSIIWWKGDAEKSLQVSVDGRRQGVTKKHFRTAGALKICKVELFRRFVKVAKDLKIQLEDLGKLSYRKAKLSAKDYQENWSVLKQQFKVWPVKDATLLDFSIVDETCL